jgi:oxygen-independent coproporphyrinogen-3 oxidase
LNREPLEPLEPLAPLEPLGLYIHIPFCSAICNYCNFNRGLFDAAQKARYVDALVTEIQTAGLPPPRSALRRASPERSEGGKACITTDVVQTFRSARGADTIYFGGGTPSLLDPADVSRIIASCRASFEVAADAEVTLEANPETVDEQKLAAFRAAGVNRLSFGVQSFREVELQRLSRLHTAGRARQALSDARAAGFDNVSLDLMMWLPGQSVAQWLESVDAAIAVAPDHLSLYLLEVYPNAPLRDEMARARWSQAPDDDAAAMYVDAMERLEAAGYEQYEISNVARPGRRARHNLKYWQDGDWFGFGCGAHGTVDGIRTKNVSGTDDYITAIGRGEAAAVEVRRLSPREKLGDALFMGLRLTDGIDLELIRQRYGVDVWQTHGGELEPFVLAGILRRQGARLALTRQGMLLANEVMSVFV